MTPGEGDRLLLHLQASLAQRRRDRGLRLNVPEARALIADAVCEWARDGLSLADVRARAVRLLGPEDVLPGVIESLAEVRVEARFDDGTRLVVVKDPFGAGQGGEEDEPPHAPAATGTLTITNEAPTAIGLTSHIHLAEANPRLRMDRAAAYGMRPAVATGETVWIRAGESRTLPVVPIAGDRVAVGTTGVVDGPLDDPTVRERALATLRACGYLDVVDGELRGEAARAEQAMAALLASRRRDRS
ncbi:MAG: urease subunit gamma [Actinomycetota bacterium]